MVEGLCLHSAGGKSAGGGEAVCEFDLDDVAGRSMARGELEFFDLGWFARVGASSESLVVGLAG